MTLTIQNERLYVEAETQGAQLCRIRGSDGTEYLWQGDPAVWEDRAPVLFPYVGRLTQGRYLYDGKSYPMTIHGFASASEFQAEQVSSTEMRFHLFSSPETRQQYPFDFHFTVSFCLEENTLIQTYTVTNTGMHTQYFGLGSHPGFNVPLTPGLSFEDYSLIFDRDAQPVRLAFSPDCFLADGDAPFCIENNTIPLRHALFDQDAIVLRQPGSSIRLCSPLDHHSVTVDYQGTPYLSLWHMPFTQAGYVCIEPWFSLPSRKSIVEDLTTQPSLLSLQPGSTHVSTLRYTLT